MVIFSLNILPLQKYSGSFIYNSLMLRLCLYPITYSLRVFISGNNPLEINISLMLMSFMSNIFLLSWLEDSFFCGLFFHQNL